MSVLFVNMRTDRPGHVQGEVVSVAPDGTIPSAYEERMMLVVSCAALPEANARTIYLRNGVPQNLLDAVTTAQATLAAARAAQPPVQADIDAAFSALMSAEAAASPSLFPARMRILDVTAVPALTKTRIAATWSRLAARLSDRETARLVAVRDWLDAHPDFGPLSVGNRLLTPRQWLERLAILWQLLKARGVPDATLDKIDRLGDAIRNRADDAERAILVAEFAGLAKPAVLTVTLTQLQNATVLNA